MRPWIKTGSLVLVVLLAMLAATAVRADDRITIHVRPTVVLQGDVLEVRVATAGRLGKRPRLRGAAGFDVLGSSEQSNVQFINGTLQVSREFVYTLRALKTGKHSLRAVVEIGGKPVRSKPVRVRVVSQQASPPMQTPSGDKAQTAAPKRGEPYFVDTRLSNAHPMVGELVLVEYRIYLREDVRPTRDSFTISEMPEFVGFTSHELPKSNRLNFEDETIDGVAYRGALLRRFVVFPAAAGEQALGTMQVKFRHLGSRQRHRDPLFDMPFFQGRQVAVADSRAVAISVQPLPTAGRPAGFSGLVGNFKFTTELDRSQVAAGEPFTLTMLVEGEGNLEVLSRPKLDLPPGLRVYSDKDNTEMSSGVANISGKKTFETILIAAAPGEYEIPPLRIAYFAPREKAYQELIGRPLEVRVSEQVNGAASQNLPVISREAVELRGRDLRYIHRDKDSLRRASSPPAASPVVWALLALWPLLVAMVILLQIRHGRLRADRGTYRSRRAMREAKTRLTEARRLIGADDSAAFYAELHRAVLGFVADKFDAAAPGLERDEVAALLRERHVADELIQVIQDVWHEADAARFAGLAVDTTKRREALDRARLLLVDLAEELDR